jgi:hypothetical protein
MHSRLIEDQIFHDGSCSTILTPLVVLPTVDGYSYNFRL